MDQHSHGWCKLATQTQDYPFFLTVFLPFSIFFYYNSQDAQLHHLEEYSDYCMQFHNFPYGENQATLKFFLFSTFIKFMPVVVSN